MPRHRDTAQSYLFGDSDVASRRLLLLAQVFAPSSRAFLERFRATRPRRVLDLGCGPGHTTRLLAETFIEAEVRGLDSSAQFIAEARRGPAARVSFKVGDVMRPVEDGPWDLIYARYLLTHLSEPGGAIESWGQSLTPGGLILIEENDWIHSAEPAFARYLEIVGAMLASQGLQLYVGAQLEAMADVNRLRVIASEVVPIKVDDHHAAAMFRMNMQAWRNQSFIRGHVTTGQLDQLECRLEQIVADASPRSSITFGRRRLVLASAHGVSKPPAC